MKTAQVIITLFFPLILQSQSTSSSLPVLTEGNKLLELELLDSALIYARSVLSGSRLDLMDKSQALLILGKASFSSGDPEASVLPLQKSLSIARRLNHKYLILKSLVALSASMGAKEHPRLDSVMIYLEEARPLAEALKDTSSIAKIYNQISNVYFTKSEYEKALANNVLFESFLKNSRFDYEKGLCYYNTGNVLMEIYYRDWKEEDLKNAKNAYQKSIEYFKHAARKTEEAYARIALGGANAFLDNYKQAEQETKLGIALGNELDNPDLLLNGYYNLANQYEGEGKMSEAKTTLNKMNELLQESGTAGDIAFVRDQFSNNEIRVSTTLVKNRIDLLDKQIKIAQSRQEKLLLTLMSILLVLIFVAGWTYSYQKNKLLVQQQRLTQQKLENTLKSQEIEFMRARFEGEEEGRHRIARQIHDGVGGLLVSAKWNLESALEEISSKEAKVAARLNENLRLQENSYRELRRVVHALEREDVPWWEDLQRLYRQMGTQSSTKIQFYTYNLDRKVRGVLGEEARLIVQEIITNALKHANASEINVQINQINDMLGIIIEDNGSGFDATKILRGVGFKSIEERCSKLGGSVSFESEKGHGTTVFVDIPVDNQNILKENPLLYAGAN